MSKFKCQTKSQIPNPKFWTLDIKGFVGNWDLEIGN
jgi:hypothetical protein